MSSLHCPYCEVAETLKAKTVFEAIQPIEGRCPDCGAWLDAGQVSVKVNSYADIYKGAVKLMQKVVTECNRWLDYMDINTEEYTDDGEKPKICIYTSEIVDALFVPYCGGTTKGNFKKALGIDEHEVEFELYRDSSWE